MNELNTTARRLMKVRAHIERLKAEEAALTDKLKGAMEEAGTDSLTGDGWKASWKRVQSSRFDVKVFRAENPELSARYTKKFSMMRFLLTV